MCSGCGLDELAADADLAASLSDTAFQYVADAQLSSNLLDLDNLALVCEARIAGDDEQRFEPRERGDDVLYHAIREIFLLGVAGQILERQDGDGRLVGECERWSMARRRTRLRCRSALTTKLNPP